MCFCVCVCVSSAQLLCVFVLHVCGWWDTACVNGGWAEKSSAPHISETICVCGCVCVCVCVCITHLAGSPSSISLQQHHKPSGHELDREERVKKNLELSNGEHGRLDKICSNKVTVLPVMLMNHTE